MRTHREYGKAGDPVVILRRRFGGSEAGLGEAQNCRSAGDAKEAGRMEQHNHLPPGDGRAVVPAGEHRAQPFWSRIVVESEKPMLPATWVTLACSLVFLTTSYLEKTHRWVVRGLVQAALVAPPGCCFSYFQNTL